MMRPRPFGLLLLLVTLLVFLQTTFFQFINYDDEIYVLNNPFVNQGLSWLGFKWAFAAAHASNWHPLTWLSHMLDCNLFRLNPAGPHLVNSLFHAANAALVFALVLRLTNPPAGHVPGRNPENFWPAALVAALFAWHPLHVESVAWVAERKDVLSTFFSLLTLLSYAKYAYSRSLPDPGGDGKTASKTGRDYFLTLIWFVLALLSKPMPVTLPVLMLILDFWPLNRMATGKDWFRSIRDLLVEKLPFFLLSGALCVITVLAQHRAESTFASISLQIRLENALTAYIGYLGKMMWPLHLTILYPYSVSISQTLIVESALLVAGISALAWLERRANPYLLSGWLWFLVTLLPVIGLIQVGSQSMADRYTYFPLIGIFLAASFSLQTLAKRFAFLTSWLVVTVVASLVACVILTERQLSYWHDSETLFRHAIAVEDSEVARLNLGAALQDKNEIPEAMTQFLVAWRWHPDSVLANFNVAGILASQGNLELSAAFYGRAARGNTWNVAVFENYGRDLVSLKRYSDAEKAFAQATKIDPLAARPHFLMARLFLKQGRDPEAVVELDKAIALEPQNLEMILFAVSVLASSDNPQTRDGKKANALAGHAVEVTHGQQAAALDSLAMSCAELGRFSDAVQIEEQAISMAKAAKQQDGIDLLKKRLGYYQKNQPWRESFKSN
jgi:tetratricopeptide (TPR) repeat protein